MTRIRVYHAYPFSRRTDGRSILTHEILVIVVIGIVENPVTVLLIESAQSAAVIMLGVNGATTLEARLPEAFVQALAETASGDL